MLKISLTLYKYSRRRPGGRGTDGVWSSLLLSPHLLAPPGSLSPGPPPSQFMIKTGQSSPVVVQCSMISSILNEQVTRHITDTDRSCRKGKTNTEEGKIITQPNHPSPPSLLQVITVWFSLCGDNIRLYITFICILALH